MSPNFVKICQQDSCFFQKSASSDHRSNIELLITRSERVFRGDRSTRTKWGKPENIFTLFRKCLSAKVFFSQCPRPKAVASKWVSNSREGRRTWMVVDSTALSYYLSSSHQNSRRSPWAVLPCQISTRAAPWFGSSNHAARNKGIRV